MLCQDSGAWQGFNVRLRRWFGFFRGMWGLLLVLGQLQGGYLPQLWRLSTAAAARAPWGGASIRHSEIPVSVVFVLLEMAISTAMDLPWSLYGTFVVEGRHGFNKQTPAVFAMDMLKTVRAERLRRAKDYFACRQRRPELDEGQ